MEPSKDYSHVSLSKTEPDNVEYGQKSQKYMVDPVGRMNSNVRPLELTSAEAKPVLNYSIQTGEEFALKFMCDRVNLRKPLVPIAAGDPGFTTGYMKSEGVFGINHSGSEGGSDISALTIVEKAPKDIDSKNSSLYEAKSNFGSVASVTHNSSGYNSDQTIIHQYASSRASDGLSRKVKILCSFGGKILHRPRDGKLRYVGGETRIIRIQKDITWQEIWHKTTRICINTHTIKYQLPGEDLDALVSVSSDEDLQNMMEECNVLVDGDGSKKLRVFLFTVDDLDGNNVGLASSGSNSEVQYVVAVNGMDIGLNEYTSRVTSVHPASSINQYSELILPESSNAHETNSQPQSQQGRMHHDDQKSLHSCSEPHTCNYTHVGGSTPPLTFPELVTREGSLSDDQSSVALGSQYKHKQEVDVIINCDSLSNQDVVRKNIDHLPVEEETEVIKFPLNTLKNEGRHIDVMPVSSHDVVPVTSPLDVINHKRDDDNDPLTYTNVIVEHANSQTDLIDLSYREPPLPQSLFRSERYHREQAELSNRLIKSDDLHSQFLVTNYRSDIVQQNCMEQSGDNLQKAKLAPKIEHSVLSANLKNTRISDEGLPKFQNNNEAAKARLNEGENRADNLVLIPGGKTSPVKGNTISSTVEETIGVSHHESNITSIYSQENSQPFARTGISPRNISRERGDISIDINDRFPHEGLSEIFSKAVISENSSGITLQKSVHNEFSQKDVSLVDKDFSSRASKVKEDALEAYKITPLLRVGIYSNQIDSQNNFGDQKELPGVSEVSTIALHSKCNPSLVEGSDGTSLEYSGKIIRKPELEDRIRSLPPLHLSLSVLDVSSLQIIKNEDLEEVRELGSGTIGTVYHGKWRGSDVAIKRIHMSSFAGRTSRQDKLTVEFWREAEILSKLHHPNVVAFYGVVKDGPRGALATVVEFMVDGSLRQVLLRKDRHLDHQKKLIIAMDAAFGMEYLHSKNIVHFDLKCDNLLVNLKDPSRPICKVSDFGLSKIKRNTLVPGGVRKTLPWMAPELLNGSSNNVSKKVNVFSFGIVLWEILTGDEPYANMRCGAIIRGVVNNSLRPAIPNSCNSEWRKLMEQCWAPNPMLRPTFTEIAQRLRIIMAAECQTRAHVH